VYGPGDEHISVLLRMVRSLPVIPTIGDGDQQFQPIWHRDLAQILAGCVERDDIRAITLDAGGPERTSQNDLVARLRKLTDRPAMQAPVPELIAGLGIRALGAVGIDVPFTEAQLDMLADGNVAPPDSNNALEILGVPGTSLAEGLSKLVDNQPEQLPSDGVGTLERKRYWVDIDDARVDADALFDHVRENFSKLMPSIVEMKAEPGTTCRVVEGETLTLDLPLRGHVQVRVAEAGDRRITLLTLAGHPIAGAVRFEVEQRNGSANALRFQIEVHERPASVVDEFVLRTVGEPLQRATWVGLAENVAKAAGGTSGGVQTSREELDGKALDLVNKWAATLSAQMSRNSKSSGRD
jgi:NADH dehydrogenase